MMAPGFPCDGSIERLPGPAGEIEVLLACPEPEAARAVMAVICHPHSLHGGSLHNKVVHMLARALGELGARTVRFNFRGVGASGGSYDRGIGETDDLLAVVEWARARRPDDALWLAGFSFGAYVAARAAARLPVAQLVSVAPPVAMYDFAALPRPACPWLVVQGDADEVVAYGDVERWAAALVPPPRLTVVPGAGHFFHRQLNDLKQALVEALAPAVPARASD
jgi:hypothetical protein